MSFNNETLLSLLDCYIWGIGNYASEIWETSKGNSKKYRKTSYRILQTNAWCKKVCE